MTVERVGKSFVILSASTYSAVLSWMIHGSITWWIAWRSNTHAATNSTQGAHVLFNIPSYIDMILYSAFYAIFLVSQEDLVQAY
jgi:hypothetical protein